jgi:hypothetical protein
MSFSCPIQVAGFSGESILVADPGKSNGFFGKSVLAVGAAVGAIGSLGAVAGFLLASFVEAFWPQYEVNYGEWISYSGAMAGFLALVVEVVYRAS